MNAQAQTATPMADTRGSNLYRVDAGLPALLKLCIAPDLFAHLEPHLDRLDELAGGRLDALAGNADRNPPVLHHRDRTGADRQLSERDPLAAESDEEFFEA